MTRDYKHARKSDRRKRSRRRSDQPATPGWVWMLGGLVLGLVLAGLIYVKGLAPPGPTGKTTRPTSTKPMPETRKPDAKTSTADDDSTGFDFYEMLPNFEIVIPEKELDARRDRERTPVRETGSYILQVGAFQNYADADRVKAKLALLGVESRVQRVSIDNQAWHRVRIGPINDLDELNALRTRLFDAGVEMLIIRSGP